MPQVHTWGGRARARDHNSFPAPACLSLIKAEKNNSLTCRKKTAEDQNFQLKKNVQQRQKKIKEAQEEVAEDSGSDPS